MRILVVDDHRNTLISMSIALRRSGHAIEIAGGAEEALALLAGQEFDCVVCDVRMQPVGGFELAREVRSRSPMAAIVLMTAFDISADEKALADELHARCVQKPIRVDALLDMIQTVTP